MLLASSTVMVPSLPTLSMASAISSPMKVSPFAEMVPTWDTSLCSLTLRLRESRLATAADTAFSMPRLISMGLNPEVTARRPCT